MQRAVVVFSGGQDSTTCLIQALQHYQQVCCLTFDYGQRHRLEIEVAAQLAGEMGAEHKVLEVGLLNELTVSSLTRATLPVPTIADEGIPNSFVPGRNILFLTLAAIYAYQIGAERVITGVCETDFSNYPDCRAEFIHSLQQTLNLGLAKEIQIDTPLMWLTKAETWALADYYRQLEKVRHHTLTCYNGIIGDGCGNCIACQLRNNGLQHYLQHKEQVMKEMKGKMDLKDEHSPPAYET